MGWTSMLDALECCPECYRDGEIVPLAFPVRRNVDGEALCDGCADLWDADEGQRPAPTGEEEGEKHGESA